KLGADTGKPKHAATTWVVNGVRSKPLNAPEPRLLGHALPEDAKAKKASAAAPAPKEKPVFSGDPGGVAGRASPVATPLNSNPGKPTGGTGSSPPPVVTTPHRAMMH